MKQLLLVVALSLAAVSSAFAQATTVQQSPQMLNACTPINTTAAVNTTVTVTVPAPPAGQYVYVCGIDITISFNTGGPTVMTNLSFTSTNLGPAGSTWAWKMSSPGAASTTIAQPFTFQLPIRATNPGTAVTVVSPAINATAAYSITVYYFVSN